MKDIVVEKINSIVLKVNTNDGQYDMEFKVPEDDNDAMIEITSDYDKRYKSITIKASYEYLTAIKME